MTSITSYENDTVTFTQETTTSNGTDSYWCNYYKVMAIAFFLCFNVHFLVCLGKMENSQERLLSPNGTFR